MNRDGGPVAAQSQLNPTPCLLSPLVASAGKQLRNRVPKQTCLHRRAGVRTRGGVGQFYNLFNGISYKLALPTLRQFALTITLYNFQQKVILATRK